MNHYDKDDVVRCTGHFTNNLDADIDPTNVYFKLEDPYGTQTTQEYGVDIAVIKDSPSHYYVDVDAKYEGIYTYRFVSSGVGKAGGDKKFVVDPTPF